MKSLESASAYESLRGMLASQEAISLTEQRVAGWSAMQTAASDAAMGAGLGLVDLALGVAVRAVAVPEISKVGGRPIYKPLLAYAMVRAGVVGAGSFGEVERGEGEVGGPAVRAWWELTGAAGGRGTGYFSRLVEGQRSSGEFLDASPYESPDLHWYDELVILHAAASYAAITGDETVKGAVVRAADFHLGETQPDHATTQPWALHAFVGRAYTRPLGDLLIHAAMSQNAGRLDVVGRVLLADAVLGLGGRC